jgi:hypothetical protein
LIFEVPIAFLSAIKKALKMSTTKPFSQWTVIALREFLKERGVRSSGLKAQLVYIWR